MAHGIKTHELVCLSAFEKNNRLRPKLEQMKPLTQVFHDLKYVFQFAEESFEL